MTMWEEIHDRIESRRIAKASYDIERVAKRVANDIFNSCFDNKREYFDIAAAEDIVLSALKENIAFK